ncbi:MAG: helix-turn-helix domain-containing protein [Alphaproteobacteria bacterium]
MASQNQKIIEDDALAAQPDSEETHESPGVIFEKARKKLKQSHKDVSDTLRISQTYIIAIEEENVEALPEKVFTFGFVRTYAQHLSLDCDRMVALYQELYGRAKPAELLDFPSPIPKNGAPKFAMVMGALFAGLVLYFLWYHFSGPILSQVQQIPSFTPSVEAEEVDVLPQMPEVSDKTVGEAIAEELAEELAEERAEESAAVVPVAETPAAEPAEQTIVEAYTLASGDSIRLPEQGTFKIVANSFSWLEIQDITGRSVVNRNLQPGESIDISAQDGLTLSTGNAGGIGLSIDGQPAKSFGKTGQVLKNISFVFGS